MTDDSFTNSDSMRSAAPLRHAQYVTFEGPMSLELGGQLTDVTVAYETYGRLDPAGDNAVLICHALSGDSHAAAHDADDDPGWWDVCVGPGKPIDTDKYFVICPNILGGCRGTTGPGSTDPSTGRPYGNDFPTVTIGDMVVLQRRLVDHLGVGKLLAAVGGSMGGQMALCWAKRYPERIHGCVPIAATSRVSSQALGFDIVGRNAIMHDPAFRDGQYYDDGPRPDVGLALARMVAHITYLSPEAMSRKFEADRYQPREVPVEFEKRFSVGSYLGYMGARFVDRFDANSYIRITTAMDLYDLGQSVEELSGHFADFDGRWLIISFTSDWLFTPGESRAITKALIAGGKRVTYCNVTSNCGHDAFLMPDDVDRYGELIRALLANLAGEIGHHDADRKADEHGRGSIFGGNRLDYDRMMDLIDPGASVLDLGCGSGGLLLGLKRTGHHRLCGVDIDENAVLSCARRGLDVVHADLEHDLSLFGDGQFDYVVLSRTVQTIRDVTKAIDDMLRVGRRCIVTFPNFGYYKLRAMLAEQGRAPEAEGVLKYKWYETPNLRFFTIADFEDYCRDHGITVHRRIALDTEKGADVEPDDDPNLRADLAIFVISRP